MPIEYLDNKAFERLIVQYLKSKDEKKRQEFIAEDLAGRITRMKKNGIECENLVVLLRERQETIFEVKSRLEDTQRQLAEAFQILANRVVRYANYKLVDSEDAEQEGVMICFEKVDRFDPKKGKAFNYMTTCILNHYRQLYRTARNYNELKKKYQDFMSISIESRLLKGVVKHTHTIEEIDQQEFEVEKSK